VKLAPLSRAPHLPTQVASSLSREIIEGRLRPGDRLPTEQALAQSFGVSRNVVREAIARLRSEGMVSSKPGVGAFVLANDAGATLRLYREALRDRSSFRCLFELRAILEIDAAGLAAERRSEDALAAITGALERMRAAADGGAASIDADLEFHRAVASATGNSYIATFVAFISEQVRESIATTRANGDPVASQRVTVAEHGAIYQAIVARQRVAARRAMQRHIANGARRLGVDD
jgi:GntR family transcriptional repressor for pyruvate dehydrogenase complex